MADFNIELTKEQQQYLVFAVLVIGGGGFSYVKYFWLPTSEKIKETAAKIEEVDKKIQKAQRQAGQLNKIKTQLAQLNEEAEKVEKQLPKDLDLPGVIDTVSNLAKKNAVLISSFGAPSSATKAHFKEITFMIAASGSYHDLGRFLAALALEERIYNARNLNFSIGAGASPGGESNLTVTMQLVSYQYKG